MQAADYFSILEGALITLAVALPASAMGIPFGLGLALIRRRNLRLLSPVVAVFVSLFRAAPAVTLVLLVYYAIPEAGIQLPELPAAIITLTLGTTAYNCEIWRSALLAFPRDQYDAALAIGMTRATRFRLIILPQIFRASLPALINEMTLTVKVTPMASVIGLVEITRAAVRVGAETYEPVPPFIFALFVYFVILVSLIALQRFFEFRQSRQGVR